MDHDVCAICEERFSTEAAGTLHLQEVLPTLMGLGCAQQAPIQCCVNESFGAGSLRLALPGLARPLSSEFLERPLRPCEKGEKRKEEVSSLWVNLGEEATLTEGRGSENVQELKGWPGQGGRPTQGVRNGQWP